MTILEKKRYLIYPVSIYLFSFHLQNFSVLVSLLTFKIRWYLNNYHVIIVLVAQFGLWAGLQEQLWKTGCVKKSPIFI